MGWRHHKGTAGTVTDRAVFITLIGVGGFGAASTFAELAKHIRGHITTKPTTRSQWLTWLGILKDTI